MPIRWLCIVNTTDMFNLAGVYLPATHARSKISRGLKMYGPKPYRTFAGTKKIVLIVLTTTMLRSWFIS